MPGGHHHRSGGLRQSNKKNKRSKASKRSLNKAAGGKTAGGRSNSAAKLASQSKADRRNTQQQKRAAKRNELLRKKRGLDHGVSMPPPRVVGIISLGASAAIEERLCGLISKSSDRVAFGENEGATVICQFDAFKKDGNLTLLTTRATSRSGDNDDTAVLAALDLARVCDVLLLVTDIDASRAAVEPGDMEIHMEDSSKRSSKSSSGPQDFDHIISDRGDRILSAIKAQGLPTPITILAKTKHEEENDDAMTLQSAKSLRRSNLKRHVEVRRYANRFATTEFGSDNNKVIEVDLSSCRNDEGDMEEQDIEQQRCKAEAATLVRTLCSMSCSPTRWVASSPRPYLVSDEYLYDATNQELSLTGYIRGTAPFDVNSLLHVPGLGTFACKSVQKALAPLASKRKNDIDVETKVLTPSPDRSESLDMFAVPDALMGEQNLVGFDEGAEDVEPAAEDEKAPRPEGWSDYQASWLGAIDDDLQEGGADHGELALELNKPSTSHSDAASMGGDLMDIDDANKLSTEEHQALIAQRRKEESEHQEFPDEVEVDEDGKASDRFARYRSLKSFRKSYWDPKENLPDTYASIFHLRSFKATQRAVKNDAKEVTAAAEKLNGNFWGSTSSSVSADFMEETNDADKDGLEGCVPSGSYITLTLANVPPEALTALSPGSLVQAVSLLPHENKVSVLHMNLCQTPSCYQSDDTPVKSKDVLTFRCGWKTWKARPVFSQNNLNCDKHKFERFLPQGGAFFAASVFGPITYTPCPVLVFRESENKQQELVAIGSMIGADADRIVVKRIVLTGYPVRVHKRHATVKYMFYNPEDVKWFKPAGLYTKHGLVGNILDSVGEHGTMKCLFNAPIKQHDTVCLPLYKRIFPKYAPPENDQGKPADDKTLNETSHIIVR